MKIWLLAVSIDVVGENFLNSEIVLLCINLPILSHLISFHFFENMLKHFLEHILDILCHVTTLLM